MMEKLHEETVRIIRCCLGSVNGGMAMDQLAIDYVTFMNHSIPFKQLGHDSLESFLQSVDSLVVRKLASGQVTVIAKRDPRSSHIADMVARQKTAKKKPVMGRCTTTKYPQNPKRWRPVSVVTYNNNNSSSVSSSSSSSLRIAQSTQFVTSCNKMRTVVATPNSSHFADEDTKNNVGNGCKRKIASVDVLPKQPVEADTFGEQDLVNFARILMLGEPEVKILQRKSKNVPLLYDCKIKIDGAVYSSYPRDFRDPASATQHASRLAMAKLIEKYGGAGGKCQPISTDSAIIERIPKLVGKHTSGIWSWQVEVDYKDLYKELLPSNWINIMKDRPNINVDEFGEKFILQLSRPEHEKRHALGCDVSIPMPVATFDSKGYMSAKIIHPVSAGEIWCRKIRTNEAASFDRMIRNMNECYEKKYDENVIEPESKVIRGSYYAAWRHTWLRVRALELRDDCVQCFSVDHGEDLLIGYENIFALDRLYAGHTAQAFVISLAGLETLFEVECPAVMMELVGVEVTLKRRHAEIAQKIFNVVMYDIHTSVSYNEDLMISIAAENARHTFDTGNIYEVHVSHINRDGMFYVQRRTPGYNVLLEQLEQLQTAIETPGYLTKQRALQNPITRKNSKERMYFAKLEDDEKYQRVQIVNSPPNFEHAQFLYVDVGATRIQKMCDVTLIPLDTLSAPLSTFPPQALPVRLHLPSIPTDLPTKMKEFLPRDSNVLLRVQHEGPGGVPNVMLFVKHTNGVVSVNDTLTMNATTCNKDSQLSPQGVLTPPASPTSVPSTGTLKHPRLPSIGESFRVKVLEAVNPWNFFVQPLESSAKLHKLMIKLQNVCAKNVMDSIDLSDIKEGNIYAAKGNDGAWYRVCVLKAIYPTAIIVFYVDYGLYATLSYQQIYNLDTEFLELPYQALKAKLAGIKPIQDKWSIDAGKQFENAVKKRAYVSTITAYENDEFYPCDKVLVMKLVMLSFHEDLQIGDWLIQEKLAATA